MVSLSEKLLVSEFIKALIDTQVNRLTDTPTCGKYKEMSNYGNKYVPVVSVFIINVFPRS